MKSLNIKHRILSITFIIVSVVSILSLNSCNNNDNEVEINDNYYVRYVIKGNGAYGHFSNWTVSTPDGNYTNNGLQVRTWTQTYGPVNKGFKCNVQIRNFIGGTPSIEIHVSKNQEPFSLKENRIGNSASYTINF